MAFEGKGDFRSMLKVEGYERGNQMGDLEACK